MKKVLLLGGGLQGLSFGESLFDKRNEYSLSVISNDYSVSKSRFFSCFYEKSDRDEDEILADIFSKERYEIIVPMSDGAVKYLSRNKNRVETGYSVKCAVPDYGAVSIVSDKGHFMRFCEENGIPHPKTMAVAEDTLEKAAGYVGFPSLIKPDFSVGARGITKVNSLSELQSHYPAISRKYGSCTLQEFIDNPDYYYNVMIYRDSQGRCDTYAIIKIVRMFPVGAGSSTCCISVENEELLSICKDALEKLDWHGMADFDVLQRKDTLEYRIIEINPRVPASMRAAYVSGVDFPETIILDTLGERYKSSQYLPGKILRFLGTDLLWFLKSPRRFKTSPSWFRFIGRDIYYQDIFKKDPSTWYSWFISGLKKNMRNNHH